MPYEPVIDAVQILRSTLYLLEHTQFPQKNSQTIRTVVKQLQTAIGDLEIARHKLEVLSIAPPQQARVREKRP